MAATVTRPAMAVATPTPAPALDVPYERVAFENAMRLWSLGVRFATRDLVALGRPFELHLTPHTPTPAPSVDALALLGFDLSPLYGSYVMRVIDSAGGAPRMASRIVPLHSAPTPNGVSPLNSVRTDDFLVGINGDDLLLAPSSGLEVRKRILRACNAALARGNGVVTLRFVRVDAMVQVDPSRGVTYGSVLRTLADLTKRHDELKASFDQLLTRNRTLATQRLTRHKKVLGFCVHMVQTLKDAVMQDERYKFAAKFQQWYAAIMAETEYEDGSDSGDESDIAMDDYIELGDAYEPGDTAVERVPPVAVDPSQPPAQPRPTDIDLEWHDVLHPHEMKWLPTRHNLLTKFIEGLVDGFASDGHWVPEIATRSRSIAELLVDRYTKKLRSSMLDNATVRKEFLQHARMLRSNLAHAGNKPLRSDVLSGAISVATLCAMTSEQLAPKALQADRQRRSEQHTREITLTMPSGPVLKTTKHGLVELPRVNAPPTLSPDAIVQEQVLAPVTTSAPPVPPIPPSSADDVTQRLSGLDVRTSAVDDKKATTSATSTAPPPPRAPTLETVVPTADDGRALLMMMFDPAQDLEGAIGQLQSAVHSTPLSTMSNEFVLAPGVKLYRDIQTTQTQRGSVYFRARVRLLNWKYVQESPSDRDATMNALHQLLKALQECRRLFGTLLDQLHRECHYPQPGKSHRAHHLAIDLLVRAGMKVNHQNYYSRNHSSAVLQQCRADAQIDGIDIATVYADSVLEARDRAARSTAAFMSELVAIRLSIAALPHCDIAPVAPPPENRQQYERTRPEPERYYRDHQPYADPGMEFDDRRFETTGSHYGPSDRKRPFDHMAMQPDNVEPPAVRRKTEAPPSAPELNNGEGQRPPALFFEDSKGEERRAPVDPAAKERQEKLQVETYQELLRALFRNRADVKAQARFTWNADVAEQVVEFTSRLKVTRTISRSPVSGNYVCSLQGLDRNLFITNSNPSLSAAAEYVTQKLHEWLDGIFCDWTQLLDTYNRIAERKLLQRGKQADARLSAGNETRKDRAVSAFTKEQEKIRGSMSEYTISVRSLVAIRQVCLNMKMAKRAAGEDFRDLLDWMNRTRQDALRGTARPTAPSPAPPPPARAPAKPKHQSNLFQCSDDSDDDDDEDYGGGYSDDDDDWHPQAKASDEAKSTAPNTSSLVSVRLRVEEALKQPYPMDSESGSGDDARFRAVIRSLFTPQDDLCRGISGIRGALKYRGHFDTQIVPNVRASIRLELLRGDTFNVYASVNDVIQCRGTATSKPEACDVAVDGLLRELDRTRQVWTEMIHFYHTKELANNDPMDSFNALRLANIAMIETRVESPPTVTSHNRLHEAKVASDIHCAIYFGANVVYRVNEAVESDAHTMATCRALRFVVDLIDKGLDPRPMDEQDQRFALLPNVDWRCTVQLQDYGDRRRTVEYPADARWAISSRVPGPDFGLPSRLTLRQFDRVPMQTFEQTFGSSSDPNLYYFRLEATYENGKFVNHVAEYNHKNKYHAYVLHCEVVENRDIDVYLFPPGASVNSMGNLYWSHKVMPSEIDDFKSVYGYAVRRR